MKKKKREVFKNINPDLYNRLADTVGDVDQVISIQDRINKFTPIGTGNNGPEYEGDVFIITIPEGGGLSEAEAEGFSGFSKTGEYTPKNNVVFFAKVIGVSDKRAPMRDWGYNIEDFNNNKRPI